MFNSKKPTTKGCSPHCGSIISHQVRSLKYPPKDPSWQPELPRDEEIFKSVEPRFWSYVKRLNPTECWEWIGKRDKYGYGFLRIGKIRSFQAHRISYLMFYKIQPGNLFVCHSCDNPPCVNPSHLWLGTAKDNSRDMVSKGRGRFQKNKKVTED
jgi:hypothetical protein